MKLDAWFQKNTPRPIRKAGPEDEARDESGKWTTGGGGGAAAKEPTGGGHDAAKAMIRIRTSVERETRTMDPRLDIFLKKQGPDLDAVVKSAPEPETGTFVAKIGWTQEAREAALEARKAGRLGHDHPVYTTREKVRGYNGPVNPANAQYSDSGRMLRSRLPLTKEEHIAEGDRHVAAARDAHMDHAKLTNMALDHLQGRGIHPGPLVSGVVSDKFDDRTKDRLRGYARAASGHGDAAMAHYSAARLRLDTARGRYHSPTVGAPEPAAVGKAVYTVTQDAEPEQSGQQYPTYRPKGVAGDMEEPIRPRMIEVDGDQDAIARVWESDDSAESFRPGSIADDSQEDLMRPCRVQSPRAALENIGVNKDARLGVVDPSGMLTSGTGLPKKPQVKSVFTAADVNKGEVPAGILSGDPVLHDDEDEEDNKKK